MQTLYKILFCGCIAILIMFIFNIDTVESFGNIQPEDFEVYKCYFKEQFTSVGGGLNV
jgi:hypothetical protein